MIHIIRTPATQEQLTEMLQSLQTYVKLAVDIQQGILAGGGEMHADCEELLLDNGSEQEYIWGADWNPKKQEVTYESLINIRPHQNNRSLEVQDPKLRKQIAKIVQNLLGGL